MPRMVVGGVGNGASTSTALRAFVYGDCRIVDLTSMIDPASRLKPYVTLSAGRDINNSGWIGVEAFDSNHKTHALLLIPKSAKAAAPQADPATAAPQAAPAVQPAPAAPRGVFATTPIEQRELWA